MEKIKELFDKFSVNPYQSEDFYDVMFFDQFKEAVEEILQEQRDYTIKTLGKLWFEVNDFTEMKECLENCKIENQ